MLTITFFVNDTSTLLLLFKIENNQFKDKLLYPAKPQMSTNNASVSPNENTFIVDLDDVWKNMGFKQKNAAVIAIKKSFTIDVDYKECLQDKTNKKGRGGHNIKKIMMTNRCYKLLCFKVPNKSDIHDEYLNMEFTLYNFLEEKEINNDESKGIDELESENNHLREEVNKIEALPVKTTQILLQNLIYMKTIVKNIEKISKLLDAELINLKSPGEKLSI